MWRIALASLMVALFVGADDPKNEKEKLQGQWTMDSVTINGEKVPEDVLQTGKLTIDGDKYAATLNELTITSTYKLDTSKDPKQIDFTYNDGPQKGQTLKGIYKIDGDAFTLCRGVAAEAERPKEFAAKAGSGYLLVTWKARKPAKEDKSKDAAEAELAKLQGVWQLVSAETDGVKAPEERIKDIRVTIAGNHHTVRLGDRVLAHNVSFAINPNASPKQVTDTIGEGPDAGKQILGIYRVDGDTLTSCVAQVGKERPNAFESKPGSGHTLRVFRRAKTEGIATDKAVADEYQRFEGTWRYESFEVDGKKMPIELIKSASFALKGNQFTYKDQIESGNGTFTIDPTVRPKTIEVSFAEGPNKGETLLGIYELDGDTYKVCLGMPGKDRPKEFATKEGSGHVLEVFRREKP